MDNPPPKLYVLEENAAQCTTVCELEIKLDTKSTTRKGTAKKKAPPAALLEPEAQVVAEVIDEQLKRKQLLTRKTLRTPIEGKPLDALEENDDEV